MTSFADAVSAVQESGLTGAEKSLLNEEPMDRLLDGNDDPGIPESPDDVVGVTTDSSELPEWVTLPAGLVMPPKGRRLVFLRFPPDITEREELGERWVLCWSLTVAEERAASQRMRGDPTRYNYEFAKAMLRVVDGQLVDWTGGVKKGAPAKGVNPDKFMEEVGYTGREILSHIFNSLHSLSPEKRTSFFANCVAIRNT